MRKFEIKRVGSEIFLVFETENEAQSWAKKYGIPFLFDCCFGGYYNALCVDKDF